MRNILKIVTRCAIILTVLGLVSALASVGGIAAEVRLAEYGFNVNGTFYDVGDPLPDSFYAGAFDGDTGIGTLAVAMGPGAPGSYYFIAYFDHEIDADLRPDGYFNEYGATQGTPAANQSWEIDEPGWVFGDIYDNAALGALDNINGVPVGAEDDVSMALGWDFSLAGQQWVVIRMIISDVPPVSGFYLSQTDPDSAYTLFFSSTLTLCSPGDVNGDGNLALDDVLLTLQAISGWKPASPAFKEADVSGDGRIGTAEVIYLLQYLSTLR